MQKSSWDIQCQGEFEAGCLPKESGCNTYCMRQAEKMVTSEDGCQWNLKKRTWITISCRLEIALTSWFECVTVNADWRRTSGYWKFPWVPPVPPIPPDHAPNNGSRYRLLSNIILLIYLCELAGQKDMRLRGLGHELRIFVVYWFIFRISCTSYRFHTNLDK